MHAPGPMLETRGLVFETGGHRLIDGIDLALGAERRLVVMGANGAGKSLLLRLMHGLIKPTAGSVRWQGRPLDRAARDRQAMVFQRSVML
ncbi:MAG: ATP-binding cassette domain-containing protein, partial [Rhizobiales bacterium]|nr:ATP-binding cassette domain-containing protein [Hyphomicrobiales bacterium]